MTTKMRVLIVDDEALACNLIQEELEVIGHEVVGRAFDGRQAVEMVEALRPDMVLMDFVMPGMNGLEATRLIQGTCPTPVVLLTAHDGIGHVQEAGEAGVGAYLVKLPSSQELARSMAIAMARFADLAELRRLNGELKKALDEVKTLRGILPICSSCRKVRSDEGYWQEVEVYVEQHSDLEFSHGLCDRCSKALYPEEYEALMRRKAANRDTGLPGASPQGVQ